MKVKEWEKQRTHIEFQQVSHFKDNAKMELDSWSATCTHDRRHHKVLREKSSALYEDLSHA